MDKHEYHVLLTDMGLQLNDQELEHAWRTLDLNGSGEVDFEEFVAWYKTDSGDGVTQEMRRILRLTTILTAAKGALVYAVDAGNRQGKKALKDLFDYLDEDGSTHLGTEELTMLVEDLHLSTPYKDILAALDVMDRDGNRQVDFEEFTKWWCSTSGGPAGSLRSKLKLAAFTSKKVGSVLTIVHTSDEGADEAEKYMNELLSAAFSSPNDMEGRSLGIFGADRYLRIRCHAIIGNPYTDRILLALIFGNVGLIAIQAPGGGASVYLAAANIGIMIVFTTEMGIRIIANGFFLGETAYLSNGWNVFDFLILSAVWMAYGASLFLDVPRELSTSLVMLRSLRALRFFVHIRNILASIVAGRTMLTAVILMLLFVFLLFYVVGFQTYGGVFTVRCAPVETNCSLCVEELWTCPDSIVCQNDNERCFRMVPNITDGLRVEHTDKYGFDSFGQALLSLSTVVTLDDWREIGNQFRASDVDERLAAWPIFAGAVVALGLFSVNLFAAALAYSYIKVRKHARNIEASNNTKKNLVQRMLVEKSSAQLSQATLERHYLQHLNPSATRQARHILKRPAFDTIITCIVGLNITCMAAVSHDMSPDRILFFEILEGIFTAIYTFECLVKLQAHGFKEYFSVILNRLDFVIVCASLSSYVLRLFGSDSRAKKSSVFRLLRLLKLFRAARIAKFIFRNPHIKEMVARAFAGIESLMSLVVFILFALCLAAIAGMNLLYHCSDTSSTSHSPSFVNSFQSLLVVFQVFTADSWGQVMYNTIECRGYSAAVFFVSIVCICYFVLGNLFVAIFMENLEIDDDIKRDKQVLAYMELIAIDDNDGPQSTIENLHHAMDSVSNMLAESSKVAVLQRKGPAEFMKGARLLGSGIKKTGRGVGKLGNLAMKKGKNEGAESPGSRRTEQIKGIVASVRSSGMDIVNKAKYLGRGKPDTSTAVSEYEIRSVKLTPTEKLTLALEGTAFNYLQVVLVLLAIVHSALDPTLEKYLPEVSNITLADTNNSDTIAPVVGNDHSDSVAYTNEYWFLVVVDVILFIGFMLEMVAKVFAYSLCAGAESVLQTGYLSYELFLVILQCMVVAQIPYTRGLLALRSLRILYLVERFKIMVKAFIASLSAVWTILILMAATFLAFGIVGMGLYSGRLWYCHGAEQLDKDACDALHAVDAGVEWQNRDYHFDNILDSMTSLFIVWSLQGWTTLWYWTMDATEDTWAAPAKDNDVVSSFLFFSIFIIWNSFMLTKLFTGMLCDFFSQSSGSVLMTAEQRNWQFMSMFLGESLKHEISRPSKSSALRAFLFIHNKYVQGFLNVVIVLSVVSMIGQQSILSMDPTGLARKYLQLVDEYILVVYALESLISIAAFGLKGYIREYKLEILVIATLSITVVHTIFRQEMGIHWLHWVQSIQFVRGLRLVSVFSQIHAIKKIYFLMRIATPQVVNLTGIMSIVFFVLGCCAQHLCADAPRGDTITDLDNFDTVASSVMLLFQICTGQSLMGVITECRAVTGPAAVIFFIAFFVTTNMLLVNLFIALLLDNFDLMGSEDMAVSDTDIELFKRTWLECGLDLHGSVNVLELQSFVMQDGMGTFSMMPKADHHYFNRVVFELGMTHNDVMAGKKEVHFFPLILALCHIRFSSSCLSIADEVEKSQRLVQQHENHAARVLQIQARAWLAWHNPPKWVEYRKMDAEQRAHEQQIAELNQAYTRPNINSTGQKQQDDRSDTKKLWDLAVNLSSIWCMNSLIRIDRITPEHVVAEAFSRLQELVDKGSSGQKMMKVSSTDTGASLLGRIKGTALGHSGDSMLSSSDSQKRTLVRQKTTNFSGDDEQQSIDVSTDDNDVHEQTRFRFGRKQKIKETAVISQNPLLRADSDDYVSSAGKKVANPLMMLEDSEDTNQEDGVQGKSSKQFVARKQQNVLRQASDDGGNAKPVDKRLIYTATGKHQHWLAETYEEESEEDEEDEQVVKESYRARRARKKLEVLKAKQKEIEDRKQGIVTPKEPRRFHMATLLKSAVNHESEGESDSEESAEPKPSKLPHWLAEPGTEAGAAAIGQTKRDTSSKSRSMKVANPLFGGSSPKKAGTTVVNPLNTVANPLMATMTMDLSSDSDDGADSPGGMSGGANFLSDRGSFASPSMDAQNPLQAGGVSAEDLHATLAFKKKKAFMSRKTTIS